ncbi:MAG: cation:proton antiporter [Synechococcales bacterium]|nr:cation:proton antiporter [Synechococcales bacterium]
MIGHIILRLTIWFLLTANFSTTNIIIGVAIAFLLPRPSQSKERLGEILLGLWEIIKSIPQAYQEAVELIFRPHTEEEIILEKVRPGRSRGMIFLDIFLITFTPKTTVLKYRDAGFYEVHRVFRKEG